MVLPGWSTFAYETTVPAPKEVSSPWPVRLLPDASERTSGDRVRACLVGTSPSLEISDAGPTPQPGWVRGRWRPDVQRSRMTFRASESNSRARSASLYVDRGLISRLREADVLSVVRTACAGLGLSVVREGRVVVAVGAVTQVPLGSVAKARLPGSVIEEAEAVFRRLDATFEFRELPIELTIGGRTLVLPGGSSSSQEYEVAVLHGFRVGTPGVDECVAIAARGICPATAATATAQLLDGDSLEIEES